MNSSEKPHAGECLVVVDYQNDFVNGALGFEGAEKLEDSIAEIIGKIRSKGGDIIFTLDTHDAAYLHTAEGIKLPVPHCISSTLGHELYGKIRSFVQSGDAVIYKPSFGSGELFELLKAKNYRKITLVGLVSNICVLSNAVIAKTACPEADVIVPAALTASSDKKLHEEALDVMRGLQIDVI